jgi:subtilisin family serine protease
MPANHTPWGAVAAVLAVALTAQIASAQPALESEPAWTPAEVLVVGTPPSSRAEARALSSQDPFSVRELARNRGVKVTRARAAFQGPSATRAFPGGAWVLSLETGVDPVQAARLLAQDPAVLYAGPNHVWKIRREPATEPSSLPVTRFAKPASNDTLFSQQYALVSARVPEAWNSTSGQGVLIAVIDTGVELDHPDLADQIAVNAAERDGIPGFDDDGNGFVDDVDGYDFTDAPGLPAIGDYLGRDPDPTDDIGHGTQVAGVACAARDNGIGIAGVAPGARLLAIRAGFKTNLPFFSAMLQEDDAAAAVLYAADRGARVMNLSFGDVVDAPVIRTAIEYARDRGVLVVVSAGNTSGDAAQYPATYPGVLSVGASDRDDNRTAFSTFGQDLDLLAPGLSVLTTTLGGGYKQSSGTSFSAPMTAGVAALVWSLHPNWSADQVAWRIRLSARREGGGWTAASGWGLLDAAAAVGDASPPPVVQVENVTAGTPSFLIEGTVADPDLLSWGLSMVPEDDAMEGDLSREIVVVESALGQAVAESLGSFVPPVGENAWIVRLRAKGSSHEEIEERSRFFVPASNLSFTGLVIEAQVGEVGWDVVGSWSSSDRHQGAVRMSGAGAQDRFFQEPTLGTHHGVRVKGPLPAGNWTVEVLARPDERSPYVLLKQDAITVPAAQEFYLATAGSGLPPGTPMPRTQNWDGDPALDVLVEAPPTSEIYGEIKRYEILMNGDAVERNSSGLFRGIPVDAADADGDGGQELVVFRLDGWSAWEGPGVGAFPNVRDPIP